MKEQAFVQEGHCCYGCQHSSKYLCKSGNVRVTKIHDNELL
jgi:hypothetical protein